MTLKFSVDDINSVDENLRDLYTESDGQYVLDVEGAVPKSKLDEFRNNNIELNNKLSKFKNVDPDKYSKLLELQAKVDEHKLVEAGKVDEAVEARIGGLKEDYENRLSEVTTKASQLEEKLQSRTLSSEIGTRAMKAGVHETAVDDVMLRAKGVFSIDDKGNLVPKDSDGNVIYGKSGTTPMSPDEWLKDLSKNAPHLFKNSQGGGASNTRGSAANRKNMSSVQKIGAGLE